MISYMYICKNCGQIYKNDNDNPNEKGNCPECNGILTGLHITSDEWSRMTDDEKSFVRNSAQEKKSRFIKEDIRVDNHQKPHPHSNSFFEGVRNTDINANDVRTYNMPKTRVNAERPAQKKTWLWVIGWLFIFPLPLTVLLLRNDRITKAVKYIIIAFVWFLYLIFAFRGCNSDSKMNNTPVEDVLTEESVIEKSENNTEKTSPEDANVSDSVDTLKKEIEEKQKLVWIGQLENDVTGVWRVAEYESDSPQNEIALDYYKAYFEDDKEIHALINKKNRTTARLTVLGDMLVIAIYEYQDGEEKDAKKLFGGDLINEYGINLKTGEYVDNIKETASDEEEYLQQIKEAISDQIGTNEEITDISLIDGILTIKVDISNANEESNVELPLKDIAEMRVSSITDAVLEYDDALWEQVIVDFENVGKCTNNKTNIKHSAFGRYFDHTTLDGTEDTNAEEKTDVEIVSALMTITEATLKEYFGDDYSVTQEENVITVNVWQDGIAMGAILAKTGDKTTSKEWKSLLDGAEVMAKSLYERYSQYGYHIIVNVLNDQNKENTLVMYYDGILVYDAVD